MPIVKLRATTILGELEQAQTELVGKAVILSDGKAGMAYLHHQIHAAGLKADFGLRHELKPNLMVSADCEPCVYREPKHGRSGGEVRPRWRVN
jgi:hypothetical protein